MATGRATSSTPVPTGPEGTVWRDPAFVRLFVAQALAQLGGSMSLLVLFEQVLNLSGRARDLGKAALLLALPMLVLTPIAGTIADRVGRRRIVAVAGIGRCLVIASYVVATDLWHYLALVVASASLQALSGPAALALPAEVLERRYLVRASSARVVSMNLVSIAGPPLGGVLCALVGPAPVFLFDALTTLVGALLVASLPRPAAVSGGGPTTPVPGWRAVVDFLRSRRGFLLFVVIETTFLAGLFAIQNALGLVFIERVLGRTVLEAGVLRGCLAAGSMVTGLLIGLLETRLPDKLRLVGFALIADGIFLLVFSLSRELALTLAMSVAMGGIGAVIDIVYVTIVQVEAPHTIQGRLFAMRTLAIGAVSPIAIALGAYAADLISVHLIFLASALLEIALAIAFLASLARGRRPSSA